MRWRGLLAALAGVLCIAAASDPAERLPDPAQEARARAIFEDVRCLVCQNESIDDSAAELARDLRTVVRQQIRAGLSGGNRCLPIAVDDFHEAALQRQSR